MNSYSLSHLSDHALLRDLATSVNQDRATTATMLAQIAEVDERKLYRPAAYESMYAYCVGELRMSDETAFRRIRVARTAREFPTIFPALADGRLNLTAALLLAPYLVRENAYELLAAAMHRTKAEIELLLAEWFPKPDLPTLVQAIAPAVSADEAASPVVPSGESNPPNLMGPLAPEPVVPTTERDAPPPMEPLPLRSRVAPLSADRFGVQLTFSRVAHEKLRYAQALLGHAVPSGDIAEVFERGLDAVIEKLEKQKFAKAARSRPSRGAENERYVPAEVRRTVWERDHGGCTFVSEHGRRCEALKRLELDHIDPVARGGQTTVNGVRLRCRAHNQYTAECTFGARFMETKREAARCRAVTAKAKAKARAKAKAETQAQAKARDAAADADERDVFPWLRALGYSVERARHGRELCAHIPDASLEERVKTARRGLSPTGVGRVLQVTRPPS